MGLSLSQDVRCFFTNPQREATHLAVSKTITCFHIRAISNSASRGVLQVGGRSFRCILGKNGRTHLKREGDGKSPKGKFKVLSLAYRPDRIRRPHPSLPTKALSPNQGWCDDAQSGRYNRPVLLPCARSHEALWRDDCCYDILGFTDHNQRPRVKGLGSAIFLHVFRPGQIGTEGCIALSQKDLSRVLAFGSGTIQLSI
jgi:L,D-peptidoglycan transpeptidase YkuD (ErfK/YbiS/YcfS/YnhG family)